MPNSPCAGDARSVPPSSTVGSELAKHFRHALRCSATPQPLQLSLFPPLPAAARRCCLSLLLLLLLLPLLLLLLLCYCSYLSSLLLCFCCLQQIAFAFCC